jgi:hypothetical protein
VASSDYSAIRRIGQRTRRQALLAAGRTETINTQISHDQIDVLARQLNMRGRGQRELIASLRALDDSDSTERFRSVSRVPYPSVVESGNGPHWCCYFGDKVTGRDVEVAKTISTVFRAPLGHTHLTA